MPARLRAEKTPWLLLLVFVLLSAGIAAVGLSYYAAQKATILEEERNQLAAIVDLKIGQIEAWRLERLGDARIMRDNALVNSQIEEFLDSGAAASHQSDILAWMEARVGVHDYTEAVLVAPDESVRLAAPPTAAWIGPTGQAMVEQVLQTGEAAFSDLHRAGPEAMVHLDLVIPLRVEDGGDPRSIGVLILRIDPSIYLFPLVQSWPTSSPSAETLLVRREGDQVLYLNQLRHVSGPPLTLSLPISQPDLPAAMAVQGAQGVVEGNDYRGVPVMAALRQVPNTSWFMVAKVDRDEVLAPMVAQGRLVGGIVVILVLVAGVSTALLWRVQRAESDRKQVEAELERKVLTEHFGYLSKYANDAIVLADHEGRIVEANERAEAVYGCSRDDLLRMDVRDLRSPEEKAEYSGDMRQVEERKGMVFETVHVRKDGTTFPVEVSSRFIEVEGRRFYQDIIRDITERKRAEEALRESEARYRRLHESMTDCYVQTTMLGNIVDVNRSYLAMLAYSEEEAFKLRYQDLTPARWHAFEQQIVQTQIMPRGYSDVYEKEYIRKDGTVFPVELRTYLLRDAQGQPSGMWAIVRDITERKRAEEALRESEERYKLANRATFDAIWDWNLQTNAVWWNESFQTLFGYRPEEIEPGIESWTNRIHPEDLDRIEAGIHAAIDSGRQSWSDQYRFRRKDGGYAEIHDRGYISREASGNPVRMIGAMQDITERMRTEERQATQERIVEIFLTASDDEMYNEVLKVVLEAMRSQYGVFGYIDGDGALVVPSMTRHIWDKCQAPDKTFIFPRATWGDSSWPRAIRERRPNYSNEVSTKTPEGHVSLRRHISLPILLQGEVIGLFQVANKEEDYTEADVRSLESIAGHIAPILSARLQRKRAEQETHKLNEELEQRVVERTAQVERRNRELSVLYQINRATAESLDLEKTLNNAAKATFEALDIEVGGIYLLEPEGEMLRLRVHRGISDETAKNLEWVKLGEGMSGKAAAEKKPLVLDLQNYPSQRLAPYIVQENLQSSASVPLLSGGQAVGAINLSTRRVRAFPPEEMALLTAIGQQLGSAVQNARLYEEVQRELAERKRTEQHLRESTAQLEAANKELEAFSYSVSHDLRAPLRAIDGFSRIVLDEHAPALAPEAQRYLHLVQDNTQQMGRLVDDLLAFSHLSRQPMAKQLVDPGDLVQAALQNLHVEQAGRQIDLVIRDLPPCQADPGLLKQVWVNLLSNALKFTRRREGAVIEVGAYEEDTHPVYYVKDNGVGFDMRYVGKLFGVFQRLHKAEEYEGTGVGLAIVQRIIHRHGGRVWAEAKVDQGATFWFTLEGGTGNDEGHRGDPAGRGQSE